MSAARLPHGPWVPVRGVVGHPPEGPPTSPPSLPAAQRLWLPCYSCGPRVPAWQSQVRRRKLQLSGLGMGARQDQSTKQKAAAKLIICLGGRPWPQWEKQQRQAWLGGRLVALSWLFQEDHRAEAKQQGQERLLQEDRPEPASPPIICLGGHQG